MGKKKKGKKSGKEGKGSRNAKKKSLLRQGNVPAAEEAEAVCAFHALSDKNRMKILNMLSEREMTTAELLQKVDVVQSTMSHHMKVLCECGLVSCRKEGKRTCYSLRTEMIDRLEAYLAQWNREKKDEPG